MALTPEQIKVLNEKGPKMSVQTLLNYIVGGYVQYPQDLPFLEQHPAKKAEIERHLAQAMNQKLIEQEAADWAPIEAASGMLNASLQQMIDTYLLKWGAETRIPTHVDRARELLGLIEENDWNIIADPFNDIDAILGHLRKYPNSVHRDLIDDNVWLSVQTSPDIEMALDRYLNSVPAPRHAVEAGQIKNGIAEWRNLKNSNDIFAVYNYVQSNPTSPFINQARVLLEQLKQSTLTDMKYNPGNYGREDLAMFKESGIFTDDDFLAFGVMSRAGLALLESVAGRVLPDLPAAFSRCSRDCEPGCTDVYLFGIPSTGKTCVLMGLLRSMKLSPNLAVTGGPYAETLIQYVKAGCLVPRTPGDFITTIKGTIKADGDVKHEVNLVELSGEEFAFKLANDPDTIMNVGDMGVGAAQVLANDNKKIFFFIVDPTTSNVSFKKEVVKRNAAGDIIGQEEVIVNIDQELILQKMINILEHDGNSELMKKVNAIHIIVTKSDLLPAPTKSERDRAALDKFVREYGRLTDPLIDLCNRYGINEATDGIPQLYTFSLGDFFIGGIYDYKTEDSDKLIDVIRYNTQGFRRKGFLGRMMDVFNKPTI